MSKKIMITETQAHDFNRMLYALRKIWKFYQTPEQLRRGSEEQYGLGFEESIEMAYENLRGEAYRASKGVKEIKIPVLAPNTPQP